MCAVIEWWPQMAELGERWRVAAQVAAWVLFAVNGWALLYVLFIAVVELPSLFNPTSDSFFFIWAAAMAVMEAILVFVTETVFLLARKLVSRKLAIICRLMPVLGFAISVLLLYLDFRRVAR